MLLHIQEEGPRPSSSRRVEHFSAFSCSHFIWAVNASRLRIVDYSFGHLQYLVWGLAQRRRPVAMEWDEIEGMGLEEMRRPKMNGMEWGRTGQVRMRWKEMDGMGLGSGNWTHSMRSVMALLCCPPRSWNFQCEHCHRSISNTQLGYAWQVLKNVLLMQVHLRPASTTSVKFNFHIHGIPLIIIPNS